MIIRYSLIAAHLDHGITEHPHKVVESFGCKVLNWEPVEIADCIIMRLDRLPEPLPGYAKVLDSWEFA
jgi:hypothetical protein